MKVRLVILFVSAFYYKKVTAFLEPAATVLSLQRRNRCCGNRFIGVRNVECNGERSADRSPQEVRVRSSRRSNFSVRRLLSCIVSRLDDGTGCNWIRTRNYLYHAHDKLTVDKVERVLDFLQNSFSNETARIVIQECPRILRKNCKTNLIPTLELLNQLYGVEMVRNAVHRNPGLLLTRGTGYNADSLELVEVFLKMELHIDSKPLDTLKRSFPALFQTQVSKLISVIHFLREYLSLSLDTQRTNSALVKLLLSHPQLFLLSVDTGLRPRVMFLKQRCYLDDTDIAKLVSSSSAGAVLGLSITDNLAPTMNYLAIRLDEDQIRKVIQRHPQILGLSLANLRQKVQYFDSLEQVPRGSNITMSRIKPSLAARILVRAPAVYSLSLVENIIPKVRFLAGIWGGQPPPWDTAQSVDQFIDTGRSLVHSETGKEVEVSTLALLDAAATANGTSILYQQLWQYPSILGLSLEGNLQPTVDFFNRTGYVVLDREWKNTVPTYRGNGTSGGGAAGSNTLALPGRYLAASLTNRLLPRWHYYTSRNRTNSDDTARRMIPLHTLVLANDANFCHSLGLNASEYSRFQREAIPRLKFNSQFETWLKTGRPIDL